MSKRKLLSKRLLFLDEHMNTLLTNHIVGRNGFPKHLAKKYGLQVAVPLLNGMARRSCGLYAANCCHIFHSYMVVRNAKSLLASSAVIVISLCVLRPTTLKTC